MPMWFYVMYPQLGTPSYKHIRRLTHEDNVSSFHNDRQQPVHKLSSSLYPSYNHIMLLSSFPFSLEGSAETPSVSLMSLVGWIAAMSLICFSSPHLNTWVLILSFVHSFIEPRKIKKHIILIKAVIITCHFTLMLQGCVVKPCDLAL